MVLLAVFLFPAVVFADWKIDTANSTVGFKAYSRMHDVEGKFHKWNFTGKVNDNWTGQGKIDIDISSIDTAEAKRDRHLQNSDFFNVPLYPRATYEIKSMKSKGNDVQVEGTLTIMGTSKPLSMTLKKVENGSGATLSGEADINRMDFGVKGNSGFNPIQDRVTLKVKIVLKK